MAKKKKKIIKKKPSRIKTKVVPSKIPGVDLDVIVKRKPAKKVVKIKVKKRIKDSGTLPPMVITPRGAKYGDEPFVRNRKIPKDVTKRTAPKRKVPVRKSATERERRVKFAEENPLMRRRKKKVITGSNIPERFLARSAFDTSMLLAPLGAGIGAKAAKAARLFAAKKKKSIKKRY